MIYHKIFVSELTRRFLEKRLLKTYAFGSLRENSHKGNQIWLEAKKSSLVSGNRPGEIFLSLTRPHGEMYIKIYIKKKKKKKRKKKTKKANNTEEEKRIYVEYITRYDDILREFSLCIFNLLDRVIISSGCSYECNVACVQREKSRKPQYLLCYKSGVRPISPKENCPPFRVMVWVRFRVRLGQFSSESIFLESATTYKVCTFKNKNIRKSLLRDIFYICLFVAANLL